MERPAKHLYVLILCSMLMGPLFSFNLLADPNDPAQTEQAKPQVQTRRYVNSIEDFYIHTQNHVHNMGIIAQSLLELVIANPEGRLAFGVTHEVNPSELREVLKNILRFHDQAKLNNRPSFLRTHSIQGGALIEGLVEIYGQNANNGNSGPPAIIRELNRVDGQVMESELSKVRPELGRKLTSAEKSLIRELEKSADLLERGMNPVTAEEMNKKIIPLSGFLERDLAQLEVTREALGPKGEQLKAKIKIIKLLEHLYQSGGQFPVHGHYDPTMRSYDEAKVRWTKYRELVGQLEMAHTVMDSIDYYQWAREAHERNIIVLTKSPDGTYQLSSEFLNFLVKQGAIPASPEITRMSKRSALFHCLSRYLDVPVLAPGNF